MILGIHTFRLPLASQGGTLAAMMTERLVLRMDADLHEALRERAAAARLQPCGLATMARAVLRQALGLDPVIDERLAPRPPAPPKGTRTW